MCRIRARPKLRSRQPSYQSSALCRFRTGGRVAPGPAAGIRAADVWICSISACTRIGSCMPRSGMGVKLLSPSPSSKKLLAPPMSNDHDHISRQLGTSWADKCCSTDAQMLFARNLAAPGKQQSQIRDSNVFVTSATTKGPPPHFGRRIW
jgi:hypothetical protein